MAQTGHCSTVVLRRYIHDGKLFRTTPPLRWGSRRGPEWAEERAGTQTGCRLLGVLGADSFWRDRAPSRVTTGTRGRRVLAASPLPV